MMRRLTKEHPWLYQMYMDDGRHAVQRTDHPINEIWTDLIIEQVLVRSLKTHGGPITQGRGMTESVRYQCVFIMHQQAAIHDVMAALTSKCRNISEQHTDLGTTRSKLDGRAFFQIRRWINTHHSFAPSDTCPLWIKKQLLYPWPRVLVCPTTRASFQWFNRLICISNYLKLGDSARFQYWCA